MVTLSSTSKFAEKYLLARETAIKTNFKGGTAGFELEWNMYDSSFKPVLTVGSGPDQQSFVDYLRERIIPAWLEDHSQLEVFHWMVEWATRPYYSVSGAVYEGRLLEAGQRWELEIAVRDERRIAEAGMRALRRFHAFASPRIERRHQAALCPPVIVRVLGELPAVVCGRKRACPVLRARQLVYANVRRVLEIRRAVHRRVPHRRHAAAIPVLRG